MPISRLKCFQNHLVVYCLAVKWESLWRGRHCKICWRNAKFRSHDRSTANRNALSLWNDLWLVKVSRHGLDFLKPENRAMRRCRSLVFSQNTWITICWKVIMEFLPNDAKNILPTATLSPESCTFIDPIIRKSIFSLQVHFTTHRFPRITRTLTHAHHEYTWH